jgi:hypothetical protein
MVMKTFWNIETNEARKVAGPYATIEAALEARWFYPSTPKLYVVEYQLDDFPLRASPYGSVES